MTVERIVVDDDRGSAFVMHESCWGSCASCGHHRTIVHVQLVATGGCSLHGFVCWRCMKKVYENSRLIVEFGIEGGSGVVIDPLLNGEDT